MRRPRFAALVAAVGAVLTLYVLQATNTRLLVSWHGFLHSAIANRFPVSTMPPENPFFAGEALPYYWFYQMVASGIGAGLGLDTIRAFQLVILVSLAAVVLLGAALGRSAFRSAGVGLLVGYLALSGANPFGPVIATAKHVVRDQPILHGPPPVEVTEAVFVTNDMADEWLTQPLLPALYVGSDWRYGQNIVWFFDISSRAPAIALLMWALYLFVRPRTWLNMALLACAGALLSAINPVIGLPAAATLTGAGVLLALAARILPAVVAPDVATVLKGGLALVAGALLALPSYLHIFSGQGGSALTNLSTGPLKWASLTVNFLPICAFAAYGAYRAPTIVRSSIQAIFLAGVCLLGAAFAFDVETLRHLEGGNEHNLTNAALCALAVPAVAWIPIGGSAPSSRLWRPALLMFLLFLPTTVLTVAAYLGSPPLPIAFDGRTMLRLPPDGPLNEFYAWVRRSTPPDAAFIVGPDSPVKMSGNVSEFPAFTARTLFVDQPGYMTDAHKDAEARRVLSRALSTGQELTQDQRAYLRRLNRSMYLVTYRGDSAGMLSALETRLGKPVFHKGFVAAFAVDLNLPGGAPGGSH